MAEQDEFSTNEDFEEMPVVYTLPDMEGVIVRPDISYKTVEADNLLMDVYYPSDYEGETRLPAVIYVHGDASGSVKDWGQYVSWGQLAAASGLIGITFNHRSSQMPTGLYDAAKDVDDLLAYVRQNSGALGVNANTLCIWTCSAGAPFGLRSALREDADYVRCIVSYYGITDLKFFYEINSDLAHLSDEVLDEFSASHRLSKRTNALPPMLIVRSGLDLPELNRSIERLLTTAVMKNVSLDFMNHATGKHAFDVRNDDVRSHEIIRTTLDFMKTHLLER